MEQTNGLSISPSLHLSISAAPCLRASVVNPQRRGSVYIAVLASATILATIGFASLTSIRVQRRAAQETGDYAEARMYAQSAIDVGRWLIKNDSNWRNELSTYWPTNKTIGNGTFTIQLTDPVDGNIANSASDPIVMTGIGMKGQARHVMQVKLNADVQPVTALGASLVANSSMTFNSGTTVKGSGQKVGTNGSIVANTAFFYPNLEASGTISGSGNVFSGTKKQGAAARTMPDSSTAFNYYTTNGTTITFSSIPSATIENDVISPNSNPYGSTKNAQGIYVIDCGNQQIRIRNERIVGTLVLLNTAASSLIDQPVNWEPAVANFPSLMVKGSFQLTFTSSALTEGSGRNYNPTGTPYPYPLGASNSTTSDTYPSIIKGLIYISGNLTTNNYVTIDGSMVIGGTLTTVSNSTLDLTYESTFLNNPPQGFAASSTLTIAPGTWQQVVY